MILEYGYDMSVRSWSVKVLDPENNYEWIENDWVGNTKDVKYLIKLYMKEYNIPKENVIKYKAY